MAYSLHVISLLNSFRISKYFSPLSELNLGKQKPVTLENSSFFHKNLLNCSVLLILIKISGRLSSLHFFSFIVSLNAINTLIRLSSASLTLSSGIESSKQSTREVNLLYLLFKIISRISSLRAGI